jgi:methenyltetrahydrofolate cyclohydrolase
MSKYRNSTLRRYTEDLAARLPAPGGGSASALTACLGAALLSMVINFTLGKPKYAKYEKEMRTALEKSECLRKTFLELVDLDVAAFKSRKIEDCLNVPFMICRLCFEGIRICPALMKKGNVNLISDVGVAAVLFESAFAAAYLNVEINLKFLNDRRRSAAIRKELLKKFRTIKTTREKTEVEVGKIIRG